MPSGRLKAVLVATLATIVLVGVLAPAATLASDPPGLSRFMYAMGQVESGGTTALGTPRPARTEVPDHARELAVVGAPLSRHCEREADPANQEIVAAGKFRSLYASLDSWRRVAYWWLTGSSQATGWSTYATSYVGKVMTVYRSTAAAPAAPPPKPPAVVAARPPAVVAGRTATHRYAETSSKITYRGIWRTAGFSGYAGNAAKYATGAGARATPAVQRLQGRLVRPGRPDPRQGQGPRPRPRSRRC